MDSDGERDDMKFTVQIGAKPSLLDFYRNPWTGTTRIALDGHVVAGRSALSLLTQFNLEQQRRYEFHADAHDVVVEHERPLLFSGFRPQTYRVLVDGHVVHEEHGY